MLKLTITILLLTLPIDAHAGDGRPDWPSDINGDGRVTLAELQSTCRGLMMKADADNDNRVSVREWAAATKRLQQHVVELGLRGWERSGEETFLRIDVDRDGYLTADEVNAAAIRRFDRRDLNHDGAITFDEASRGDLYAIQP